MKTFMVELDPRVATDGSSPGHVVGMNRPDGIFVLKEVELVLTRYDLSAPSNHAFLLLEQNPADYPLLDSATGPSPGVVARSFRPLAVMSFMSDQASLQQPVFRNLNFPVTGDLLGLYGFTEIAIGALTYMLVLRGDYRAWSPMERLKAAITAKRPTTEMSNHVGVNWDVHLPR